MPERSDIHPAHIPRLLPNVSLIDVDPLNGACRIRLAGTRLRDVYDREISGRPVPCWLRLVLPRARLHGTDTIGAYSQRLIGARQFILLFRGVIGGGASLLRTGLLPVIRDIACFLRDSAVKQS